LSKPTTRLELTFKGPSHRFVDPTTRLTWAIDDTHEVTSEDAARIRSADPSSQWHQAAVIHLPPAVKKEEQGGN
jgi:hypothetical protein